MSVLNDFREFLTKQNALALAIGVIIGASIWGVLQNGLQFANVAVAWRNIIIGTIVIVSVLLDVIVRTGKRGKGKG